MTGSKRKAGEGQRKQQGQPAAEQAEEAPATNQQGEDNTKAPMANNKANEAAGQVGIKQLSLRQLQVRYACT